MVLQGKVVDGLGNASFWVKKIEDIFLTKYGIKLFHGTLNIDLKEEFELENYWIIEPQEYGGEQKVLVQECKLLGHDSYIVRAENSAHKSNIIEIVSDVNFRKKNKLKSGELVEVII